VTARFTPGASRSNIDASVPFLCRNFSGIGITFCRRVVVLRSIIHVEEWFWPLRAWIAVDSSSRSVISCRDLSLHEHC
jgi:hypothetical protein